ncbi:MAG: TonB-dependent receptor plug domain-containing protein, partial [Gammaproteobacteria bacterium]|nr:TonB-dependent receptor plug domain-containing protein [Gammaproteobacteria bacterium]
MSSDRHHIQRKVSKAVAAGLTATLIGVSAELYAAEIEEIVVTARKKSESLQDSAISVQAMTEDALDDQQVDLFTDYVQYLPNVTAGGRGPAQNEVYIRGLAVDQINITVAEAQGSAPNVALYLDDQPVTAGGRNLDVYAADLARIEVLPGPQGTLYGASSQAGTVRLITNKPVIDETEFGFAATSSITVGGKPSNSVEGVFNVPVIDNKMAIRGVLFNDNMGGYIDNLPGVFTPNPNLNPRLPPTDGIMFVPADGDPMSHEFADGTYAEP